MIRLTNLSLVVIAVLTGLSASASEAVKDVLVKHVGVFECPAYKGKDGKGRPNEWSSYKIKNEYINIMGLDVLASKVLNNDLNEKVGPYSTMLAIFDDQWRFNELFRNKTLYPIKTKNSIRDGVLHWTAEYPEYINNKGEKETASIESGTNRMDKNGDLISTSTYMTGEYRCKKLK